MNGLSGIFNNFFNSWYAVIMVLGVVFILFTAKAWAGVISRLSLYFKRKDLTVSTGEQANVFLAEEYGKIQATLSDLNIHADKEFKDFLDSVKQHLLSRNINRQEVRELIHSIFTIKEQYEFAYLNLFLVDESKQALGLLFDLGSATKKVFLSSIRLSADQERETGQKEIIFNALLCHHLIENEDGLCQVSEKGKRFLEFVGFE